jgi:4-hydroxyphenylpyruvate dioxygenase
MRVSQLAINSVTTRQARFEEALAAFAAAGFRQVEFHLPLVREWLAEGHTVGDARSLLASHNLRSIGGFELGVECFTPPESRQANHGIHRANVELIHELGGGVLVVGTDGPEKPSLDGLDVVAATLRGLAEAIDGLDVTLALEFNWGPLVKSLQSAVRVCEKADHPRVGILFDPAHYHCTPSKLEHLTPDSVRWIKHVHLDDMADKPGELSDCNADRVLPGAGILDLLALIAALERHGYRGLYSIELFNADLWQLPAAEAARRCYQCLLPLCA